MPIPLSKASHLSNTQYGYDMVMSMTIASIDTNLKKYMLGVHQPATTLCFVYDATKKAAVPIAFADLEKQSGNIDPFSIPDATPVADPRIKALTKLNFVVAVKFTVGLPSQVLPLDLPPLLEIQSPNGFVDFRAYCRELEIVEYTPASGATPAAWKVWKQGSVPYTISLRIAPTFYTITPFLDTPYFNHYPADKQALLQFLKRAGYGVYVMEKLTVDFNSAVLLFLPGGKGMPALSPVALDALNQYLLPAYKDVIVAWGQPMICVSILPAGIKKDALIPTSVSWQVGQFIGPDGKPASNPIKNDFLAQTIDCLYAVERKTLNKPTTFNWNWVDPANLTNQSGVIAVNRNTLAAYYSELLMPQMMNCCLQPAVTIKAQFAKATPHATLTKGQKPQTITYTPNGAQVLKVSFEETSSDHDHFGATYAEMGIQTNYFFDMSFSGSTISITQRMVVFLGVQFDSSKAGGNVVDKTIQDSFTLSVDANGHLKATAGPSKTIDHSQTVQLGVIAGFFSDLNPVLNSIKATATLLAAVNLQKVNIAPIENFTFPGAQQLTYNDIRFSDNQDLLVNVTQTAASLTDEL